MNVHFYSSNITDWIRKRKERICFFSPFTRLAKQQPAQENQLANLNNNRMLQLKIAIWLDCFNCGMTSDKFHTTLILTNSITKNKAELIKY